MCITAQSAHTFKGPKMGPIGLSKSTRTGFAMDFDCLILIFDLEILKVVQSFKALTTKIHITTRGLGLGGRPV
jgi:hypothetical protein